MITTLPDGRRFCDCGCEFCLLNPARTLGLTLDDALKLAARKPLVLELGFGGGWLQPVRDAAERIRLARRKEARKPKVPKK